MLATQVIETLRLCKVCGLVKPIEQFRFVQRWRLNICDDCRKKQVMYYHHRHWEDYYKKHKEVRKQRTRRYYRDVRKPQNLELYGTVNNPRMLRQAKLRMQKNIELYGFTCTPEVRLNQRRHFHELRTRALRVYGFKCECCGEDRYDMLTFDHKIKTYYKDKINGVALVYEVIREYEASGYPNDKYRILCWNCNMSRGHHGYCPHQSHGQHDYIGKNIKLEMISAYGGGCVLCGETAWEFLTIDHINGGGNKHRKQVGNGAQFYKYLRNNEWPMDEYRLLCANCNCSQKRNNYKKGGTG